MKFAINYMTPFNAIINHINIFYLSGNKGIKTLFNVDTLAEKSRLDTDACLKNMEIFFQITNLAYDFAMIKYVQTEDIRKSTIEQEPS